MKILYNDGIRRRERLPGVPLNLLRGVYRTCMILLFINTLVYIILLYFNIMNRARVLFKEMLVDVYLLFRFVDESTGSEAKGVQCCRRRVEKFNSPKCAVGCALCEKGLNF